MGFRFRKSINLGGGFKINLSKTGIGYSWGTKGYRVTRTAKGKTRQTFSIPGTGISYVSESGGKKRSSKKRTSSSNRTYSRNNTFANNWQSNENGYQLANTAVPSAIASASIDNFKDSDTDEITVAIERTLWMNQLSNVLIWSVFLALFRSSLIVLPVLGIVLKVLVYTIGPVNLEYSFDSERLDEYNRRIGAWELLALGRKEWQILSRESTTNQKIHAGAGSTISRAVCSIQKRHPYFIRTNVDTVTIKLAHKEELIILPDKVFFVRKRKVGLIDYSDLSIDVSTIRFIESGGVPRDAQVVDYTWQYVNVNGTPDRRYKNNTRIPVCLYGKVVLKSSSGLNVELQISNAQNTLDFKELIE